MKFTSAVIGLLAPAVISATITPLSSATTTIQCLTIDGGVARRTCPTRSHHLTVTRTERMTLTTFPVAYVTSTTSTLTSTTTSVSTTTVVLPAVTDTIVWTFVEIDTITSTAPASTTTTTSTGTYTTTTTTNGQFVPVESTLPQAAYDGAGNAQARAQVPAQAASLPSLKRDVPGKFQLLGAKAAPRALQARNVLNVDAAVVPGPHCKSVICSLLATTYVGNTMTKAGASISQTVLTVATTTTTNVITITETHQPGYTASTTVIDYSSKFDEGAKEKAKPTYTTTELIQPSTTSTTTLTIKTTQWTTPTVTQSTTTTITQTATASAVAQCDASNMANSANGLGLKIIGPAANNFATFMKAADAGDCCSACTANPNCSSWAWANDEYQCRIFLSNSDTCSQGTYSFMVGYAGSSADGFTLGNGNCGDWNWASPCSYCA